MNIWIVAWVNGNGTPDIDVFTDVETAMQCMRYMAENRNAAIIRRINIRQQEPEEGAADGAPEAAEPEAGMAE